MTSIRVRLLFSHLAVIVLAMGLSGALLLSFLERYFLQSTEQSLLAQARLTAQALIPGATTAGPPVVAQAPFNNALQQQQASNLALQTQNLSLPPAGTAVDLSYLANTSLQLGAQLTTRIRVLDQRGVALVDSWAQAAGTDLSADPLVAQVLATGQVGSRSAPLAAGATMDLALPVLVEGQPVGVIYLSQPLDDILVVLRDLRLRWLLSTGIALALSGLVGLLLSGAITRPLRRLTVAAESVAQGRFDQPVPAGARDELGRLSRTFNDMTTRLRAARQMQINFVADVSHELRTPLTAIKGTVETLREGALDDLAVRDRFLATIAQETDRLIRLVNDLLLLSKADSEALNLRREAVDLAALARLAVERLAVPAAAKGLTVTVASGPNVPAAWADPDRVAQVLFNLLDNAIQYSHTGGQVGVVVAAGNGGTVLVTVRDEGVGIPAADLPRIGQRFYRADKARSRAQGGSGLGLAIAQALVQAHGGELWLESAEGVGTTAHFTLPGEAAGFSTPASAP